MSHIRRSRTDRAKNNANWIPQRHGYLNSDNELKRLMNEYLEAERQFRIAKGVLLRKVVNDDTSAK